MKLLSLKAHHVFSIGDITLDLKDRGLVLVTGWSEDDNNGNMAGKSSLANRALVWGLYGRTVGGIKADAVCNTSITPMKHCGVTLHFESGGEEYRIYRARKPNCLVLSQKTYDPQLQVVWQDLSKRNEKDTQELINGLLGRDHKTFIQSDFFGQGRERSFLALPGSEQQAVIEEILPLNSLETWKETAKQELKLAQEKADAAEIEQRTAHAQEAMATNHLNTLSSQEAGWATNHRVDISELRQRLDKINTSDEVIEAEIAILRDSLPKGLLSDVLKTQNGIEGALHTSITTLNHTIDNLTGNIDRYAARPDTCASCLQSLPEERIKKNAEELENDRTKRNELVKLRGEKEALHYNAASRVAICHEVQALEKKLDLNGQKPVLQQQIETLTQTANPFTVLVLDQERELQGVQAVVEEARLKSVELAEEVDHYKFWAKAYGSDLKTMIFNQVCPFLERKTNEFLRDLDNAQIKVKFRTVKELKSGDCRDKFCVTAASSTGSKVFELFSGAEMQLTSFAVGMALSELASMQTEGASSFMILDEPFLYQSPENCERIINFITTHLVGDKATILLISNEDNLVNLVPNRVHVVKKEGVTSIGS